MIGLFRNICNNMLVIQIYLVIVFFLIFTLHLEIFTPQAILYINLSLRNPNYCEKIFN